VNKQDNFVHNIMLNRASDAPDALVKYTKNKNKNKI
jgi:hypothetical protein